MFSKVLFSISIWGPITFNTKFIYLLINKWTQKYDWQNL